MKMNGMCGWNYMNKAYGLMAQSKDTNRSEDGQLR